MFSALKPRVKELLLRRVEAARLRQIRDSIGRDILAGMEIYDMYEGKRITEDHYAWTACDEDAKRYYSAMDKALRAAGIKPEDMEPEYCPVLIAESAVTDAEMGLFMASCAIMGLKPGAVYGKRREEMMSLVTELVLRS